jgi:hypothetical protein
MGYIFLKPEFPNRMESEAPDYIRESMESMKNYVEESKLNIHFIEDNNVKICLFEYEIEDLLVNSPWSR